MIDIGRLNKRITFLAISQTIDGIGQTIQEYQKIKTVWASVEPASGKEFFEAQRIKNELTYKIFTRYIEGITEDMLIQYKNKIFLIESIINKKERNELLEFLCIEKKVGKNEYRN